MLEPYIQVIDKRKCYIVRGDDSIVILLTHEASWEMLEAIYKQLSEGCTLLVVEATNWNGDYSPWASDRFSGQGKATYMWLHKKLLPWLKTHYPYSGLYLAGYSLAGLFALWSAYEGLPVDGVGCCSGSLWYPGWQAYCKAQAPLEIPIYLSVGGKEGESHLGDAIALHKWQYQLVREQGTACHFELNPGGHFSKIPQRLAKAVNWLLTS